MNKIEQNLTSLPKVNPLTGLTAIQEQCASLLASGERVTDVADNLNVSRTTIYQWSDLMTFQCYINQLRDEVQRQTNQTIFALAGEALSAIRQTLTSENESLRLKVALWLVERIQKVEVGKCNPFSILKDEATFADINRFDFTQFHPQHYQRRLKELGLQEEDQTGKRKNIGKDYDEESMNED